MGALERVGDIGYHLLLPAVVLANQFAGGHYLLMRFAAMRARRPARRGR